MTEDLERLQRVLADRYRIVRVVGRGGMATVYLAADQRHHRDVAIKVLRDDLAAALGAERFLREIRVTAKLAHPHILPLHDSGAADGLLFYVMPFVAGESLRTRLGREGTLELAETLRIAEEVADALSYAHRQGIVHRDVKPENVLLAEGHALVADFGIAKAVSRASDEPLTRTGFAMGTPGYMSPEQAAGGDDVDERTDVYSLACVVYEMLLGGLPARWLSHEEGEAGRFLRAPADQRARLGALPGSVERALVRAMAIDPARRHATPNDLVRALTAPLPPARRYSDAEARDILRRAASLEASEPEPAADLSLTGLKRIAAEADIPSRHVAAAARELEEPAAVPTSRILGLPTGWQMSRTVPGTVPEREFPALLEIVQDTTGSPGVVEASLPGVFAWASAVGDEANRSGGSTRVQVSPSAGRTRITVSEDRTASAAVAAGVGAVFAMLGFVLWEGSQLPVILPALGIAAGGVGLLLRVAVTKRRKRLADLLDRLTRHVADAARPQLPPGGPADQG